MNLFAKKKKEKIRGKAKLTFLSLFNIAGHYHTVHSVASSSEQSTGEITALIGPQGPSAAEIRVNANEVLARVDARIVQNSTHAHNVQNRVESPLPLTNMDAETQGFHNQVQSFKASRASRLATPVKRRPIIPKAPASARRVSHEVSSYQTPSQLQRPSRIQTPGTGRSLQERMERLERILGPVPIKDSHEPPPDIVHMNARTVQDSTHANNVQNRVESPLPSHEEICDNAVEMLARVEKHEKEGRERSLTNMDLETQCLTNQVQSIKASRQALNKQKETQVQSFEASRLATPVKRRPIIPKTPASSIRRVSREISSMTTPSQMQRSSSIPTPGSTSSVRDFLRSPLMKAQTKMMFKE